MRNIYQENCQIIVSLLAMREIVFPTRHISSSLRSGAVVKLWDRITCTVRVNLEKVNLSSIIVHRGAFYYELHTSFEETFCRIRVTH